MKKAILSLLVFAILVGCGPKPTQTISVKPLQATDYEQGCGFGYSLTPPDQWPNGYVLVDGNGLGKAAIRINNELVQLSLAEAKSFPVTPGQFSIGDRLIQRWVSGSTAVVCDCKIIFICPPGDQGCLKTRYQGTMTVSTAGKELVLPVFGWEGC